MSAGGYESGFVVPVIYQTSSLTFGRDIAQFRQLITFLTIVSLLLWTVVLITAILRFAAAYMWRQRVQPVNEVDEDAST